MKQKQCNHIQRKFKHYRFSVPYTGNQVPPSLSQYQEEDGTKMLKHPFMSLFAAEMQYIA
jgi:hypothetical protein